MAKIIKKSVAIVTWIGGGNYGTSLQSFSLHYKLNKLGYNTKIVLPFCLKEKGFRCFVLRILQCLGINYSKLKRILKGDSRTVKQKRLDAFEKKYYNRVHVSFPFQLTKLNRHTDVYITGSDQIWNTAYRFDSFYFLDFAGKVKRVAYASSMGIADFPTKHKDAVKSLLARFAHIGVREGTAVEAISRLTNRDDVCQVLDPTFLLEDKDWESLCVSSLIEKRLPQKYIFCYFIGNNPWYVQQVEEVKRKTGIDNIVQISLDKENGVILPGSISCNDAGPMEFVRLIHEATLVCTDSFHATAVSINLQKDFVEFMRFKDVDPNSQNSRIYDLLDHYGLSSRIYSANKEEWGEPINYKSTMAQLDADRRKSLEYLVNAIEK